MESQVFLVARGELYNFKVSNAHVKLKEKMRRLLKFKLEQRSRMSRILISRRQIKNLERHFFTSGG